MTEIFRAVRYTSFCFTIKVNAFCVIASICIMLKESMRQQVFIFASMPPLCDTNIITLPWHGNKAALELCPLPRNWDQIGGQGLVQINVPVPHRPAWQCHAARRDQYGFVSDLMTLITIYGRVKTDLSSQASADAPCCVLNPLCQLPPSRDCC